MNRRGFLRALAVAPVAAVMAPAALAKPTFATGRLISVPAAGWGLIGESGPEINLPLMVGGIDWPTMNAARLMQQQFNGAFGATEETDLRFDEMAAYCDEPVEMTNDPV